MNLYMYSTFLNMITFTWLPESETHKTMPNDVAKDYKTHHTGTIMIKKKTLLRVIKIKIVKENGLKMH